MSIVIGIIIKYAQRNQIQNEYAELDRVGEMSLEPFVTNDQLDRDALLGSSPSSSDQEINNQTDSTLIPPPTTQESALNYDNQGYKSHSSSGLSTDTDEFRSLNDTVYENSSAENPEKAPSSASPTSTHELPRPTVPASPVLPETVDQSPPQSSSTPMENRGRGPIRKPRQRERTTQSYTRILPKRAAKKKINYKE